MVMRSTLRRTRPTRRNLRHSSVRSAVMATAPPSSPRRGSNTNDGPGRTAVLLNLFIRRVFAPAVGTGTEAATAQLGTSVAARLSGEILRRNHGTQPAINGCSEPVFGYAGAYRSVQRSRGTISILFPRRAGHCPEPAKFPV